MEKPAKTFPTLGCCGLDCGLCPRYYTVGSSRCPGCAGPDFFEKHPSCGYITCCVKKHGLEACGQCEAFPCSRFETWLEDCAEHDSFVTHRQVATNLDFIRTQGLEGFLGQQAKRIDLLQKMIEAFDDGRSRSLYCIAATVLPIPELEAVVSTAAEKAASADVKVRAKALKASLEEVGERKGVELKLRKK
jgi:hypothetical protein